MKNQIKDEVQQSNDVLNEKENSTTNFQNKKVSKQQKGISSKDIAVCGIAVALMFALAWMPVAAFLIPVIFVSCNYKWKHGLIVGTFAGGVTLMFAFIGMMAGGEANEPFTMVVLAFIMVVPRILVGLFTSLGFWGSKKFIKGSSRMARLLPYNIGASVGVITNTALVVTALVLLIPDFRIELFSATIADVWWLLLLVGLAELVVINIIMPALCFTVAKALKIGEFKPKPKVIESEEVENILAEI
ncbi:MAG: hypothetical protein FWE13_02100 [Firmicutes bacterium]|nr:hypothetical protein [Bacillota bacterium]